MRACGSKGSPVDCTARPSSSMTGPPGICAKAKGTGTVALFGCDNARLPPESPSPFALLTRLHVKNHQRNLGRKRVSPEFPPCAAPFRAPLRSSSWVFQLVFQCSAPPSLCYLSQVLQAPDDQSGSARGDWGWSLGLRSPCLSAYT